MTGQEWARVMTLAFDRHEDNPTSEQVIAVAMEQHPARFNTTAAQMGLALTATFELNQSHKLALFTRESAWERGINPALPISRIRAIFGGQRGAKQFTVPEDARVPVSARNRNRFAIPTAERAAYPESGR